MMRKRLLLIIFDGLGDRPAPELGGRTPLEAAQTPNIDRLALEGITGLVHAKSPGYALGSPIALHLLFGYPEAQFPDRGPLLARARGLPIAEGDIVLAARLSSAVREGRRLRLVERFIHGREEACEALAKLIAEYQVEGLTFRYTYCGAGDGMLFISGGASFGVTDTDPLALDLPVLRPQVRDDHVGDPAADRTAAALERYLRWAHDQLRSHPASTAESGANPINVLISKWAGPKPSLEPFVEKWGMRGASLPDEEVVSGIMMEMGFRMVEIRGREPEIDLRTRLHETRRLLDEGYEFIHLHTKYPDPMSHANEPAACRDAIEALDRAMASYWEELADDPDLVTVLTTDHTTPSVWGHVPRGTFYDQHGGEPGPIAIRGGNVRVDAVREFGERSVAAGGLGHLRGEDFMPVLLNAAERTNMYEMRPTPVRRLYMPTEDGLDALEFAADE